MYLSWPQFRFRLPCRAIAFGVATGLLGLPADQLPAAYRAPAFSPVGLLVLHSILGLPVYVDMFFLALTLSFLALQWQALLDIVAAQN